MTQVYPRTIAEAIREIDLARGYIQHRFQIVNGLTSAATAADPIRAPLTIWLFRAC